MVAPFATLAIYALIALTGGDQSLLVAQAFTSLALISLVTEPLLMFCQALPSLTQAVACFSRVEEFLMMEPAFRPLEPPGSQGDQSVLLDDSRVGHPSSDCLVAFHNADISWFPKSLQRHLVLHDLNLNIQGGFTAIIGPVGSGKTSLLSSIIGETITVSGSVLSRITSRVAFCSQTPWLVNDTIKRNIIGESDFDQAWFDFAISCCGLQQDLDNLPAGSLTVVGNNGSSLSGGQCQRVVGHLTNNGNSVVLLHCLIRLMLLTSGISTPQALARAVYSKLPVVVLDDCMSGLDPTTYRIISSKLFHVDGHFRKAGVSVIFATHGRKLGFCMKIQLMIYTIRTKSSVVRLLPHMDMIVALNDGRLLDSGSYKEIRERRPEILKMEDDDFYRSYRDPGEEPSPLDLEIAPNIAKPAAQIKSNQVSDSSSLTLRRQKGNWGVYVYYAKKAGRLSIFLWALSTLVGAVSNAYSSMWVPEAFLNIVQLLI